MKAFDVNSIKVKVDPKNQPSIERRLTDEVIGELDPKLDVEPNAELEGDEYLRFPDGVIQKAIGNKHKKGGIKMNLPDGTKIISNKLRLSAKQAKALNNEYNIKTSPKDTYAVAQKKYDKVTGLTKLYDEQEELFKELGRQQKKEVEEGTQRVNNEYLSGKISEIEKSKVEKEQERDIFFSNLYEMQESSKVKENKEGSFAYGGMSMNNFNDICKKHGIDPTVGMSLLKGEKPKFEKGGEMKKRLAELDPESKYRTVDELEAAVNSGKLSDAEYIEIGNLLTNIKKSVEDVSNFGEDPAGKGVRSKTPYGEKEAFSAKGIERLNGFIKKHRGESFQLKPNATKVEIEKAAGELQKYMGSEYEDLVYDYMVNVSHQPNKKLGKFLSGKNYEPTIDGLNKAIEEGKVNKKDVVNAYKDDKWWYRALDTETKKVSQEEYDRLLARDGAVNIGEDVYFNEYEDNPEMYTKYEVTTSPEEVTPPEELPPAENGIINDINPPPTGKTSKNYYLPNQRPMAPSPMDAHLLADNKLQRIDPIRVGIEQQIQESGERMKFMSEQTKDLPPNQRYSILANAQASEAQGLSKQITQANQWNAQAQQQAELFNIGQSDREGIMRSQNLLNFEERQLRAKGNTEEDYRNYFEEIKRQKANDFYTRQNYSLIESLTPDVSLSEDMYKPEFDPEGKFKVEYDKYRTAALKGQI